MESRCERAHLLFAQLVLYERKQLPPPPHQPLKVPRRLFHLTPDLVPPLPLLLVHTHPSIRIVAESELRNPLNHVPRGFLPAQQSLPPRPVEHPLAELAREPDEPERVGRAPRVEERPADVVRRARERAQAVAALETQAALGSGGAGAGAGVGVGEVDECARAGKKSEGPSGGRGRREVRGRVGEDEERVDGAQGVVVPLLRADDGLAALGFRRSKHNCRSMRRERVQHRAHQLVHLARRRPRRRVRRGHELVEPRDAAPEVPRKDVPRAVDDFVDLGAVGTVE